MLRLYKEGGAAYGTIKKELIGILWDFFRDAREERARLLKNPDHLRGILAKGAMKAREIGQGTIDAVRQRVGIIY